MADVPTLAETPDSDAGPDLDAEEPDDPTASPGTSDEEDVEAAVEEANEEQGGGDVNEAAVELGEDDFTAGNGLFSGVEDSEKKATGESDESGAESDASEGDDADPLDGIGGGLEDNAAALEDAINQGAARLAVVGLTEDDFADSPLSKDSLEEEFSETFAAFRLGYFGSQTIDQYVLQPADGDVNPAWGMAGAMLMATAMVVWMRPDGDEQVAAARSAVEGIVGGDA